MISRRTRSLLYILYAGRVHQLLELKPLDDGDNFEIIQPAKDLRGVAAANSTTKPEKVFGIWYPNEPPKGFKGSVAIHWHGGGYVSSTARTPAVKFGAEMLATHVADYTFAPE